MSKTIRSISSTPGATAKGCRIRLINDREYRAEARWAL